MKSFPLTSVAAMVLTAMSSTSLAQNTQLDDLTVKRNENDGFHSHVQSISRDQLSAKEAPRSVQVFNEELMTELQPNKIEHVVGMASNVVTAGTGDNRDNTFVIRGFENNDFIIDEVKYFQTISDPEIFSMKRVEIIKGPDAVSYGSGAEGGLIAYTTKRSTDQSPNELTLELTSEGGVAPKFDVGGNLSASGSTRYRVVGLYADRPSWRDFDINDKRVFIAPSLTSELNERTTVTVFAEFTDDEIPNDMGTAADADGDLVAPEHVNTHPDDSFDRDQTIVGVDIDYLINAQWSLDAKARYLDGGFDYGEIWLPSAYDEASDTYIRWLANQANEFDETLLQANLNGDIQLGTMRHRITAGIDLSNASTQTIGCFDFGATSDAITNYSTNPVYGDLPAGSACDTELYPETIDYTSPPSETERRGIFLKDAVNITDELIVTAGLRFEDHTQKPENSPTKTLDEQIVLPQIGLSYFITPETLVYASYSESFTPQSASDSDGNLLDPEQGLGSEIGIKSGLMDNKLQLTFALFQITKENIAKTDPDFPLASIASEKATAKGAELGITGKVTEKLDVIANLGYLDDAEDLDSSVAEQTASLWGSYAFTQALSVGLGATHYGDRGLNLPGYTLVNGAVTYKTGQWRAQLNLHNIADEEYIESSFGPVGTAAIGRGIHPGEPFNAKLNLTYSF
ncbi:MAG TPA: hypothetical protein DD979_11100 [Gammaproteobacteria bacterium]|nr:hypothetical protein [Gammaproteobacteria bacterium]